ncbi:methyltransferase domain-containing protein [Planctomycetota bacterium]
MSPFPGPGADDQRRREWAEDARMRFESRYERLPSWEIGRPQPAIVDLTQRGLVGERVLDTGCGTGENALYLAVHGHTVWGIDVSHTAIGLARAKARARGVPVARFLVGDALALETLGMRFDTVIDSGLFHALSDEQQEQYVSSVGGVLRPDGVFHVLCFSEHEPGDTGPRRVRRGEIRAAFAGVWEISEIVETSFATNIHKEGARAYRASMRRRCC